MKKVLVISIALVCLLAVSGYFLFARKPAAEYRTQKVVRGTIVSIVSATGTLNAVTTVQVGTQVSGTIQKLYVDFNSPVRKGMPIAQIDPALFKAQVEQTKGNYLSARASEEKANVALADARRTLLRYKSLLSEGIVSQGDYDAAETAFESARASVRAASAAVIQTAGAYRQAQTNLTYSTIRSPVDGVVISRSVDVGQTVAASFQTPTLFTIAQDLTKMQIETNVDEADISRIKVGQTALFTVDAYPELSFSGRVTQIRNAPVITQNVVTYIVVIGVDNHDLKLKPGMTANVAVEVARKDNVIKIPSAALRFRPADVDQEKETGAHSPGVSTKRKGQRVYVLSEENKARPVFVTTGIADSSSMEIVSGDLRVGDQIIVGQSQTKKNGNSSSPMRMRF